MISKLHTKLSTTGAKSITCCGTEAREERSIRALVELKEQESSLPGKSGWKK